MRRSLWSLAIAGLALGGMSMAGGIAMGSELGPLVAGYGIVALLVALYLVAGLVIRDRALRRRGRRDSPTARAGRLGGHRVF